VKWQKAYCFVRLRTAEPRKSRALARLLSESALLATPFAERAFEPFSLGLAPLFWHAITVLNTAAMILHSSATQIRMSARGKHQGNDITSLFTRTALAHCRGPG
jgi:hypothetical protein